MTYVYKSHADTDSYIRNSCNMDMSGLPDTYMSDRLYMYKCLYVCYNYYVMLP